MFSRRAAKQVASGTLTVLTRRNDQSKARPFFFDAEEQGRHVQRQGGEQAGPGDPVARNGGEPRAQPGHPLVRRSGEQEEQDGFGKKTKQPAPGDDFQRRAHRQRQTHASSRPAMPVKGVLFHPVILSSDK
jgi:hypothetical protein